MQFSRMMKMLIAGALLTPLIAVSSDNKKDSNGQMVDSGSLEEIQDVVVRDRKHLSEDGVVVPIIAIDKHTGKIEVPPEIVTRGFLPSDDGQQILALNGGPQFKFTPALSLIVNCDDQGEIDRLSCGGFLWSTGEDLRDSPDAALA